MKTISLGKGKSAIVDDEDYIFVSQFTWWLGKSKAKRANKDQFAAQTEIDGRTVKMHRLLMNAPDDVDVDHKNGDQLDNRRENLRLATRTQNLQNADKYRRRSATSSQFKGVSWHKKANKWGAYLQVNGKRRWLGLFESELEAAKAYNKAAIDNFGEFAKINEVA